MAPRIVTDSRRLVSKLLHISSPLAQLCYNSLHECCNPASRRAVLYPGHGHATWVDVAKRAPNGVASMSQVLTEITSQPACWWRAAALGHAVADVLPQTGERVAVIGCGTSYYMARAYAALREAAGHGETDAFPASELPTGRSYDRILALSRSGTTTELLETLARLAGRAPRIAVTADASTPIAEAADELVELDFANEHAIVQTRFATSALLLLRTQLGTDPIPLVEDANAALTAPLPNGSREHTQYTFLGTRWTVGIAEEAALKLREAAGAWTEAYPAMEYRHGPISVTGPGSLVWVFGEPPAGLVAEIERTGGAVEVSALDPLAELIRAQRLAAAIAVRRGLDPDRPRHLTRSVVLDGDAAAAIAAGEQG